jgi:polyferredoxin
MAFGVMAFGILTGMVFGVIAIVGAPAFYGVALPAGALGAAVSVLRRMYKGQMKVEYRTRRVMLIMYGALRPFVGGVFGALVFAVFLAGLVPNVARADG